MVVVQSKRQIGKIVLAQRSVGKGEGGRGGRGNPPSRGAQVGFELIR